MTSGQIVDQHVYASTLFQAPESGAITGVRFHVWLRSGKATVTIEEPDRKRTTYLMASLWCRLACVGASPLINCPMWTLVVFTPRRRACSFANRTGGTLQAGCNLMFA
jgi:hypothetical protein